MSRLSFRNWLILLGTIGVMSLLSGVAGVLMACRTSALLPKNFNEYGHCDVTDDPSDVFASFAILGLIIIGPLLTIVMVSWFARKRLHNN